MATTSHSTEQGVPLPIVKLNRWMLVVGIAAATLLQQPALLTVLFLVLLPAVLFGQTRSPVAWLGKRLLRRYLPGAAREDRRLMRFNNTIAVLLLGVAQLAFALGQPLLGWACALMVAGAASIALAGFCVGCFLFYQFRIYRYRLFAREQRSPGATSSE